VKPPTCYLGFHAWHAVTLQDQVRAIVCLRCGKQEIPDPNVAVRLGWDQHTHG
jgi:hypothetical protein